ncbi:GNAT family N-acetyltransferase [Streptomyces sp. DSM 44917]|uniref:GNAT family N-acetyltransferase n=1 Tax=Streptomyces boetiae TaxID=3075541 RepID=A0ABU2L806_9ACTN|nr:GNAT family N-acetyltransferase [Streptomyces sp. DSM 44917]MDT0307709.1 GNAT family N-acetyltransferase [Streptomyces sp. DSM 44917]
MQFSTGGHLVVRITPDDVGKRVSVRTLAGPGEHPARFTDTVGLLSSWNGGVLVVLRRDGRVARLSESGLVAGKVVPPGPAAGVAELTAAGARSWPAPEAERIGGWLARAAGGWTRRANSALPVGRDLPDLERIAAWYAARGLPALLHVVEGSAAEREAAARGWAPEAHAVVQVAPLAPLAGLGAEGPAAEVRLLREPDGEWLRGWPRAGEAPEAARKVLAGGPATLFALVPGGEGAPAAVGRCVVDGRFAGLSAMRVDPGRRREGLGTAVLAALARAALAEGAETAHLQVEADNDPARALYASLGFAAHHRYHYRVAPGAGG